MKKRIAFTSEAQPVTLRAVAERVGLSSGTVSVVLNQSPNAVSIPRRTQERIFAAARELDYRPNPLARALRTRHGQAKVPEAATHVPAAALMFNEPADLQRAILALRAAGLRVPGDVSVVGY